MKKVRHLIRLADLSISEIQEVFSLAEKIKSEFKKGERHPYLQGKVLGMIFEKMSLRTRVSFESGMIQMGGGSLFLEEQHIGLGKRESIADVSRVLSSMVDAIVFRAKKHETVTEFASWSHCPVINALTDRDHPCQALADILTVKEEFGSLVGRKIAWIGDANNVAASLIEAASIFGCQVVVSSPKSYQFTAQEVKKIPISQPVAGFALHFEDDPFLAVRGADAVCTDVWVSMGQEKEEEKRKKAFAPYQVNDKLMASTGRADSIFLHCLPARRGLEVTDSVIDSPRSRVVAQAENRMHAQKGLLVWLIGNG